MSEQSRVQPLLTRDAVTAVLLFLALAALFALTRSRWLDDLDSVNFALALDRFDIPNHQPHPSGYPIYVAAGRLVHQVIADHAAALTLVSSLSGAPWPQCFSCCCAGRWTSPSPWWRASPWRYRRYSGCNRAWR